MGYIKDLETKIKDYTTGDYVVEDITGVPSVGQVNLGKKAYKTKLTALCIDIRKSTELLTVHNKLTVGKLHKSFLTIVSEIVTENGGKIRSFNGDSLLAFWPANYQSQIEAAVSTAFKLKWALDIKFSPYFEVYSKLDFGIGVDWGDVYVVKAGLSNDANNNDLIFLGTCVNFATMIANQAKSPHHIEISESTYSNLTEKWIVGLNGELKVNMWVNGIVKWKGRDWVTKCTSWNQPIPE